MKHLIIYTHLNPESFTRSVVAEVEASARENGDEVKIIDLYADGFNPVLGMEDIAFVYQGGPIPADVEKYQEMISWADHLTVVYPLWWGQMPAILKGFIDRVFTMGYAFNYGETGPVPLLTGKTVNVIINTGSPNDYYEASGMHAAQTRVNDAGLFGFCGLDTKITFFGNVVMGTDEERKGYLAEAKALA